MKLSVEVTKQWKDGVYKLSRDTVIRRIAQLEAENEALKHSVRVWVAEYVSTDDNGKVHILYDGEGVDALLKESE